LSVDAVGALAAGALPALLLEPPDEPDDEHAAAKSTEQSASALATDRRLTGIASH